MAACYWQQGIGCFVTRVKGDFLGGNGGQLGEKLDVWGK